MNLPNAIERPRDVLRRQHNALFTEDSYVYWLRHYVTALNTMPSSLPSEQKPENFLLETTMGYLHAESLSVQSPLESILGGNFQANGGQAKTQAAARALLFPKSA
jgi:hypothetical protein